MRANVDVGIRYLQSWLTGTGAAAIHNLMEDVATAEISRAQLWQWRRHRVALADGGVVDDALYSELRDELLPALGEEVWGAAELLDELVLIGHVRGVPDAAGVHAARLAMFEPGDIVPLIEVKLYDHRVTDESVPKMIEALTDALHESSGAAKEHIHVVVEGVSPKHWGIAGKPQG